jgi:hypothetical protein
LGLGSELESSIFSGCRVLDVWAFLTFPRVSQSPHTDYIDPIVPDFAAQLADLPALNQVAVPDLWQQHAVAALRDGRDVVVQAPTGSGKTLIFELWSNQGKNRGQAIYTVPTRALANDKLAEWRARGWDVGIATGDLAENLNAPVLVATLETQKNRLIRGEGPVLLVVDEYQMLRDPDRGLNYELAIALAPPSTQLLLLSGSVENPQDVVKWLKRLGSCQQSELSCAHKPPWILAAIGRQGAGRRSWPDFDFCTAATSRGVDGSRPRAPVAHTESPTTEHRTKADHG